MSATITAFPTAAPATRTASVSHLRITARGRVVLTIAVLLAAVAIIAGFVLTGGGAVATGQAGDVHFDHVTVAAGETLWQVAEDVAPTADPRDVISDIVSLNNLSSTQVMPGQSLAIPTKYSN
ncbi:LysM domain-containing protein [Frondihabitans sp. PhB188]|uniref:LysM peptidoglycan-binding domain-containing protein n=1 Tax=Frondihabitans sp. PhB188 TaxID=2485200 RepID=UPI000F487A60|nr:LysM peptidoglycan-binding domain-containing protein [Frondihabitans sp. PhB188]ROQ38169.1 LysM domain-containing protein [Frondihabitans sp. PhB188]